MRISDWSSDVCSSDLHPLAVGVVGSNGGASETRDIVDAADVVVFVSCRAGSVTTERWRHPAPGAAKIVHIDVDPRVIGANYPTDAALLGDARLALAALVEALGRRKGRAADRDIRARIAAAKQAEVDTSSRLREARKKAVGGKG